MPICQITWVIIIHGYEQKRDLKFRKDQTCSKLLNGFLKCEYSY